MPSGGFVTNFPVTNGDNSVPFVLYGSNSHKAYFLKPSSGNDTNDGLSPDFPVKTWSKAHTLVTADKNDTVYVISESNTASSTTDYQSATLTLSKDGVRYIGVNAGGLYAQRSRIAQLSTATGVSPLVTISGDNCYFEGIHVFHGVADATSLIAVSVTGDRNHFYRCHFAGIGDATMDAAGAASLSLSGDENLFEECVIGLDTIARGTAANSEILFTGQATRNVFRNCIIPTFAEANTHQFLIAGASSLDRFVLFENCLFVNAVDSTATNMTEAFDTNASQGGSIILRNCTLVGATEWEAGDTGNILIDGGAPAAGTAGSGGSGIAVEPS